MNLDITYRPVGPDWLVPRTRDRQRSRFDTRWSVTLTLLERELKHLGARSVIFQIDVKESQLRLDGQPKASATPDDPGVIISFNSSYGPLRYSCDRFTYWQDNVRAIALGLEALRTVDRYGITQKGEQYTGFRALGQGSGAAEGVIFQLSGPAEAARFLLKISSEGEMTPAMENLVKLVTADAAYREGLFKKAAKKVHPDVGGSRADWDTLVEARRILDAA